jgi:hypothetical protein
MSAVIIAGLSPLRALPTVTGTDRLPFLVDSRPCPGFDPLALPARCARSVHNRASAAGCSRCPWTALAGTAVPGSTRSLIRRSVSASGTVRSVPETRTRTSIGPLTPLRSVTGVRNALAQRDVRGAAGRAVAADLDLARLRRACARRRRQPLRPHGRPAGARHGGVDQNSAWAIRDRPAIADFTVAVAVATGAFAAARALRTSSVVAARYPRRARTFTPGRRTRTVMLWNRPSGFAFVE